MLSLKLSTLLLACCLVSFSPGCRGGKRPGQSRPAPARTPAKAEPGAAKEAAPVGVVEGVVKLEQGARLPSYTPAMVIGQGHPEQEIKPPTGSCSPARDTDLQPVRLTGQGTLAGVMLAASAFSRAATRAPATHDVVIDDCRLKPALVVATLGDQLRIRNNSDYPFMPELGAVPFYQTLLKGQEKLLQLDRPGVQQLVCGFSGACGRTEVVVLHHSVYAVTDDRGAFRFDAFPAGETVVVNAWHPLFEETHIDIEVQPGETRQVELVLRPLPQYAEPPPAEKPAAGPGPAPSGRRGAKRAVARPR